MMAAFSRILFLSRSLLKYCSVACPLPVPLQIPRVDEPKVLWEKVQKFMDQYRKPPSS